MQPLAFAQVVQPQMQGGGNGFKVIEKVLLMVTL
jgi:hypothetical protein